MIKTKSAMMSLVLKTAARVSEVDKPVHIEGDAGTQSDQEMIAREIHQKSHRKLNPFVIYSCGVLNEKMELEELFGSSGHPPLNVGPKSVSKKGLLEWANGGTLYLENINKLSLKAQGRLLNFIKTKKFQKEDGNKIIQSDIRLITSSTKDLELEENFRIDLFYKINIFTLSIPSLSQRKEDIPDLIAEKLNSIKISEHSMTLLINYKWPYNTEELNNVCEALAICSNDVITPEDLPKSITSSEKLSLTYSPEVSLYEIEKQYIMKALTYFKGNKTQTAEALGITIKTLYNKLHDYGQYETK